MTWREIRNLHATGEEILTQISKYLYFEMRAKKRSRRHPSCRARTREEACGVHTSAVLWLLSAVFKQPSMIIYGKKKKKKKKKPGVRR